MLASGDQIEITFDDQRAEVATVGATLRTYSLGERAVLDGYQAQQVCPGGRGQILMPWPNRIADGCWEMLGNRQQLPIDEPELGHAIHGLVRWADWRVEERSAHATRLTHRLAARPGYPFWLDLSVEYRLSPAGLAVTFKARNISATPCPFGAGAHPYFSFPDARVDAIEMCVRAADWLELDARSIPRRRKPVDASGVDFRRARLIGTAHLDHAFTHLERDSAGIARVTLHHGRDEIAIWFDRAFDFVHAYTGDTLPDLTRRRQGVAIEPMTCAPNAFNSGDGLRTLAPGESFEAHWGVSG